LCYAIGKSQEPCRSKPTVTALAHLLHNTHLIIRSPENQQPPVRPPLKKRKRQLKKIPSTAFFFKEFYNFMDVPYASWSRIFAWLGRYRRLSKDYEQLTESSEAMIIIASISLLLHRLSPG
jgi:hypothetical protein